MATNVPGLEGGDFRTDLVERLDLPVTLDNDINLAARGEQWRGVAPGVEDFVFLSVGTGLGAGLVLRGELHRGRNGAAGEVDLVASGRADEIDPCAAAVAELTARLAAEGVATRLAPPFDARAVFGAARQGDPLGRAVVEDEARRIALHIAPIAAVTDVALVVLGGGIGANGDLLLDPIRGSARRVAAVPAARRGLGPRRRGGADGRAGGRARTRAGASVRQSPRRPAGDDRCRGRISAAPSP